MFRITEFILKWLFLNNLIDENNTNNIFIDLPRQIITPQQQYLNYHHPHHEILHQQPPSIETVHNEPPQKTLDNTKWKKQYIQNILLYPSIPTRLLALNAIRLNLVYELSHHLTIADENIRKYKHFMHHSQKKNNDVYYYEDDDTVIADAIKQIISIDNNDDKEKEEDVIRLYKEAIELQKELRDNLPQLLSIILHSNTIQHNHPQPHPTTSSTTTDPISILKSILIQKCKNDPNLGIELCWLLEANVGRNWKTLLEHRQQSGRRLIVILPADKARILANIGMEKKCAFEFLQDVEQATAYGSSLLNDNLGDVDRKRTLCSMLLPKNLSRLRCSHYGDTMHFIDLLSQLSRQLASIPIVQRNVSFFS